MKKRSKNKQSIFQLLGIVLLLAFALGSWIIWSHGIEKSEVSLNEDVAFEENRTILKMRKDSLKMILNKWQAEKIGKSTKKNDNVTNNVTEEDNWIVWKYDDRFKRGVMQEVFGDEAKYKRDSTVFKHDAKNAQLRFKTQADTAYVYVRFMTQYYSVLE